MCTMLDKIQIYFFFLFYDALSNSVYVYGVNGMIIGES
jgi:hypothetical protein